MNKGLLYALGCYTSWGLLPIYWKALQDVPALEILSHRLLWSLVFVILLMTYQRQWTWLAFGKAAWPSLKKSAYLGNLYWDRLFALGELVDLYLGR